MSISCHPLKFKMPCGALPLITYSWFCTKKRMAAGLMVDFCTVFKMQSDFFCQNVWYSSISENNNPFEIFFDMTTECKCAVPEDCADYIKARLFFRRTIGL